MEHPISAPRVNTHAPIRSKWKGPDLVFHQEEMASESASFILGGKAKVFLVVRVDATVHLYGGMRCNDVSNAAHVSIHWTVEYGIEMLRPSTPIKCPLWGALTPQ